MGTIYPTDNARRRAWVKASGLDINGVDTVEVVPVYSLEGARVGATLTVTLLKGFGQAVAFDARHVSITGGARRQNFEIELSDLVPGEGKLTLSVAPFGDRSTYTLTLRAPAGLTLDPALSGARFRFLDPGAPDEIDPSRGTPPRAGAIEAPRIDYLSRDYAGYRRMMLDRLAERSEGGVDPSPGDLQLTLTELLAFSLDRLSYAQDAVATESTLATARLRTSVRRHARLLDYPMHEACSARAVVVLEVDSSVDEADGALLEADQLQLSTAPEGGEGSEEGEVFEPLHGLELYPQHNAVELHTWGAEPCWLEAGATSAFLRDPGEKLKLQPGSLLLLEEVRCPETGVEADALPTRRALVRLIELSRAEDPLFTADGALRKEDTEAALPLLEVRWSPDDALPMALCASPYRDPADPDTALPVTLARGNALLVDHGRTLPAETLPAPVEGRRYRPRLERGPLAWQRGLRDRAGRWRALDPEASARQALDPGLGEPRAALTLTEQDGDEALSWPVLGDLLSAGPMQRGVVPEPEADGRASLRFGDDRLGRSPTAGATLIARYRIGGGARGDVSADTIQNIVSNTNNIAITSARNPLPATGGRDPEPLAAVRALAWGHARAPARAVTLQDHADLAMQHSQVARAVARRVWTGAWHTVFVHVELVDDRELTEERAALITDWMERRRLCGADLRVVGPRWVPLDVAFTVHIRDGYGRGDVVSALLLALSSGDLPDGGRGYFHPANFSFGDPVYLSGVVAAAARVPGVAWVDASDRAPHRFQRLGRADRAPIGEGRLRLEPVEIPRLDNDASAPERGQLTLYAVGGD